MKSPQNSKEFKENNIFPISTIPQYQEKNLDINKAINMILNEVNKKDQHIRELEEQVRSLSLQMKNNEMIIEKIKQNNTYPMNTIEKKIIYNNDISSNLRVNTYQNYSSNNKFMELNRMSSKSNPEREPLNSNRSTEKRVNKIVMISKGAKDQSQSRNEVKNFLNEVRAEVDTQTFREFVKYIKLLTGKEKNVNRREIFERVKYLFGKKYKELYNKFEKILLLKNSS